MYFLNLTDYSLATHRSIIHMNHPFIHPCIQSYLHECNLKEEAEFRFQKMKTIFCELFNSLDMSISLEEYFTRNAPENDFPSHALILNI